MIATLVRLIIAGELVAGAAVGFALAMMAGAGGWITALATVAGAALMPVLVHALAIGAESLTAAWWRYRTRAAANALCAAEDGEATAVVIDAAISGAAQTSTGAALGAWIGETAASLRSFFLLLPWLGGRPLPSGSDPARLPLVLVHGYFCNRSIWRPMARWLAARGHPIESPNLEPPFAGIDDYLPILDAAVERLRARSATARIGLVGHSMGALVIRRWLVERGDENVAVVVTLGAPHQGTWSARFGHGRCISQLCADNPWLTRLAAAETPKLRRRFTVVLSLHDNIVMPQAIQTLPDARTVALSGLGHVQLAHHPSVRPYVATALDRAMPRDPPGTGDVSSPERPAPPDR